jgi:hypothetical protein
MTLFEQFPLPWKLESHSGPHADSYEIVASDDDPVFYVPDYTGDGARVNLSEEQAKELVAIINAHARKPT